MFLKWSGDHHHPPCGKLLQGTHLSILWCTRTCTCRGTAGCRNPGWHRGYWDNMWSSGEFGSAFQCSREGKCRWHCQVQVHQLTWTQCSSLHSGNCQVDKGPYGGSIHPENLVHTCTNTNTKTNTLFKLHDTSVQTIKLKKKNMNVVWLYLTERQTRVSFSQVYLMNHIRHWQ